MYDSCFWQIECLTKIPSSVLIPYGYIHVLYRYGARMRSVPEPSSVLVPYGYIHVLYRYGSRIRPVPSQCTSFCVIHGFMEWVVGIFDITDVVFDLYNFLSCSSHSFRDRWALPALSCCCLHVLPVRSALVC